MARPIGITILAILQLLGAIVWIYIGALALMLALALLPLLAFMAAIPLILGIIGLILFYGLWTLKGWAWIWTLIINIIQVIWALYSWDLISLVLPLIIVIYLLVPGTRAAFKQ
ncbi:MAG: hypothetical protein C4K47_00705 [Candidatus Thorarchaeota archaeon]|nr:MAG: hypothetical protein C4K47_00705 [Candidatus Thorarchaeota archaeon]